jgi:hypothetical protein
MAMSYDAERVSCAACFGRSASRGREGRRGGCDPWHPERMGTARCLAAGIQLKECWAAIGTLRALPGLHPRSRASWLFEDPRAPYTVFRGEQEIGTYNTRAEARRRQTASESEQPDGAGRIWIQDIDDKVVI